MHGKDRNPQAGSAYIVTLLVLVVLTVMGMGLALITQTEMQMGSNERTVQRVFYAADSGLAATTARALVEADYSSRLYDFPDPDVAAVMGITLQADVSPFYPIMSAPCNLCEINEGGQYGREPYYKINYAVAAEAMRSAGAAQARAAKTLSTLVEVQPWQLQPAALEPLDDPAELAKIKF